MILGISGKKGAGKDVTADILIKHFGYKKVSWADSLKNMLSEALNIPLNEFYDRSKDNLWAVKISPAEADLLVSSISEQYGELENHTHLRLMLANTNYESLRDLMQKFGTEFARNNIDPDIWVKITLDSFNKGDLAILPDCRMPNERAAIKEMGGFNMLIKRDLDSQDSHASETQFGEDSEYDFIIDNNSQISALQDELVLWHSIRFTNIERL